MSTSNPPHAEVLAAQAASLEARTTLPQAVTPFTDFARDLRNYGFPVVIEQTIGFLRAIALLGPRSTRDLYWAARATLAPPPNRLGEFDALFRAAFEGEGAVPVLESIPEDGASVKETGAGAFEPLEADNANESGAAATSLEALSLKRFAAVSPDDRLKAMRRNIGALAPRRRGFRRVSARGGDRPDLRRHLAALLRHQASTLEPAMTARVKRHRRVLLLIDISGSMKAHIDDYLRFAHALTQALPNVETFSFGTRLTRLTKSLKHKDADRALAELAPGVADWEGGTRIGESLAGLLSVPRFSQASRGALIAVLSDGLERGAPYLMVKAVRRLSARAWRLAWLTPLAADPAFRPETAALKAILPHLDHLGDASAIAPLCDFVEASASLPPASAFPPPLRGRVREGGKPQLQGQKEAS